MTTTMTNFNGEIPGYGYSTLANDPFLTAAERAYRPAPGSGYILTDAEVAAQIDGIMERSRLWLEEILARRGSEDRLISDKWGRRGGGAMRRTCNPTQRQLRIMERT